MWECCWWVSSDVLSESFGLFFIEVSSEIRMVDVMMEWILGMKKKKKKFDWLMTDEWTENIFTESGPQSSLPAIKEGWRQAQVETNTSCLSSLVGKLNSKNLSNFTTRVSSSAKRKPCLLELDTVIHLCVHLDCHPCVLDHLVFLSFLFLILTLIILNISYLDHHQLSQIISKNSFFPTSDLSPWTQLSNLKLTVRLKTFNSSQTLKLYTASLFPLVKRQLSLNNQ